MSTLSFFGELLLFKEKVKYKLKQVETRVVQTRVACHLFERCSREQLVH